MGLGSLTARGPEVRAREVELSVGGPQLGREFHPLRGDVVALVVRQLVIGEHPDFLLVPAGHHVQPEPPTGDVVDGGARLGQPDGMNGGDMHGGEHADALRRCRDTRCPGEGFEAAVLEVGLASHAAPPSDGHHGLQPGRFRRAGDGHGLRPPRLDEAGVGAHGGSAAAVGAENTDLEFVGAAEQGVVRPRDLLCIGSIM